MARRFLVHTRISTATAIGLLHLLAGWPAVGALGAAVALGLVATDFRRRRGPSPRARTAVLVLATLAAIPAFGAAFLAPGALAPAGTVLTLALLGIAAIEDDPVEHAAVHLLGAAHVVLLVARPVGPASYLATAVYLLVECPALSALHLEIQVHRQRVRTEALCRALRVVAPPSPASPGTGAWHVLGATLGAALLALALLTYLLVPRWQLVRDRLPPPPIEDPEPPWIDPPVPLEGAFASPWQHPYSGFTREMELETAAAIAESRRPVLSVRLIRDGYAFRAADDGILYWRGRTLSDFDGRSWSEPWQASTVVEADADGWARLPGSTVKDRHDLDVLQSFHVHPSAETTLFGLAEPVEIELDEVRLAPGAALERASPSRAPIAYRLWSRLHLPGPARLSRARLAAVEPRYTRLPSIDPELAGLARIFSAEAHTDYERVRAIAAGIRETCAYSLRFELPRGEAPVRGFLLSARRGHCELFASAMVVLLRSLGIPARIAIGFRGGEWDEYSEGYIVREKDAHAWVEVPFEGHGWVRFDPVPGAPVEPGSPLSLEARVEPAASLETPAEEESEPLPDEPETSWLDFLLDYDRDAQRRFLGEAGDLFSPDNRWTLGLLGLLSASPVLWLLARRVLRSRGAAGFLGPGRGGRTAGTDLPGGRQIHRFYERALRALARGGWARTPDRTPSEFLTEVARTAPAGAVEALRELTDAFERVRYGARPLGPEEVDRVRAAGSRLEAALVAGPRDAPEA